MTTVWEFIQQQGRSATENGEAFDRSIADVREAATEPRSFRYWKLLGGTTRAASRSQFDRGCWVAAGHFGPFSVPGYKQAASKSEKMALNFDLVEIGRRFGSEEYV